MKQKIISYLSTIKPQLSDISKYIYENLGNNFDEYKSYNYLIKILRTHNFRVTENYINIPTAFFGQFGYGSPKICFICKYNAEHYIYGCNAASAMSVGAALGLSQAIPAIGGSAIIIGYPDETVAGSKITILNQHVFENIDAVLTAQPYISTAVSGTTPAVMSLKLTHNNISIDINLSSSNFKDITAFENELKEFIKIKDETSNTKSELHIVGSPYKELITNKILSRLFSHNLKEMGIINIKKPKDLNISLSLGTVSHIVPCIHSYIDITDGENVKYGTKTFADATIMPFADNIIFKTSCALAITAVDLIEKPYLISEMKAELFNSLT